MAKQVKQLDRVIIRFAGDSGDGMQLTGRPVHPGDGVVRQRPRRRCRTSPPRSARPQGTLPGRLVVPGPLRRPRHPHPGRPPRRARRDEPGRAQGQPRRPAQGRDDHRRHPRLHQRATWPRPATTPTRSTTRRRDAARRVRRARRRPDRHDRRGGQGVRPVPQGRRPREEHVRARPGVVDVRPPDRVDDRRSCEARFAKVADIRDANITAFKAGWNFGETTEAFVVQYEIKPAPMPTGTYRNITGNLALSYGLVAGARAVRARRCSSAPTRSPRPSDILHELSKHKRVRRHHASRPRTRSPASAPPSAPSFAGALGVTTTSGPGHRAEVRDDRPRRDDRAAAGRRRRPARRPLDRPADQDRAGRPAAGDVRPQRRGAGADRRAAVARRLLRRRRRGGPDRGHLPHPGDAALRRLPRQRLRAVADPRGRRPAGRSTRTFATEPQPRPTSTRTAPSRRSSGPTCATRRPSPARGRSPARPASSTASAAWRRATATATSPTTRPTTTSWSAPARPRSTGSPTRCRRSRSTTRPARPRCWCSAGARRTARSAPPAAGSARPASTSPRCTCATSTRSRRTSARSSSATTRCWCPR